MNFYNDQTVFEKITKPPEYNDLLYKEGYSPSQVLYSAHRTFNKRLQIQQEEKQENEEPIDVSFNWRVKK